MLLNTLSGKQFGSGRKPAEHSYLAMVSNRLYNPRPWNLGALGNGDEIPFASKRDGWGSNFGLVPEHGGWPEDML